MEKRPLARNGSRWAATFALAVAVLGILCARTASAQLRNVDLVFRPPTDTRVIGFHVYVSASSMGYADYRDDINFVPPADGAGTAHFALNGIEQFQNVYVAMKSYDATGMESPFSNEIVFAGQQQCLVTGCNDNNPCTTDTCTATGCRFDPASHVGEMCDDGNGMTFNDMCQTNGACTGTVAQCNVAADCGAPADTCAGPLDCVNHQCRPGSSPLADNTSCNDRNAATRFDVCLAGVCRGFACGNDPQCSDGEACNGQERCVNNTCVAGTPMSCGDGNVCNGTETCRNSTCMAGTPMNCPVDNGPCFDAFCDPTLGCQVTMHPDGSQCTTANMGQSGQCAAGVCVADMPTTPGHGDNQNPGDTTPSPCAQSYAPASDVHQELTDNPDTTRKVVWASTMNPIGSLIQFRSAEASGWRTARAVVQSSSGCQAVFSVTLANLKPGASYAYRVSGTEAGGRNWTEWYALKAAPTAERNSFKFAFFADNGLAQSAQSPLASRVLQKIKGGGYPLVLGGGGYALSSEAIAAGAATDATQAVAKWKEQAAPVIGNSVFAPVLGDTETESFSHAERAADYAEFMREAGTASAPHESYSYDFGGAHFLAVNAPNIGTIHPGTAEGQAHLAWIDADLKAAKAAGAQWIVVYMHADLFSSEKADASLSAVRGAIGPILLRNGVNLVLSGEGNSYERTRGLRGNLSQPIAGPITDDLTTADNGIVFVRSGAGGRTAFGSWLSPTQPNWSAVRDNTHAVFLRVTVKPTKLMVTAYGLDDAGKMTTLDLVTIH
jgi:hypothetical protein